MPLARSRGNTPGTPQLAELSGATAGAGPRYSMKGLALALPARLAFATQATIASFTHAGERAERRPNWLLKATAVPVCTSLLFLLFLRDASFFRRGSLRSRKSL